MAGKKGKLIDFYFNRPILCDFVLIALLWLASPYVSKLLVYLNMPLVKVFDKSTALNYVAYITAADVTLAGFIIAALTILITVKASLKGRAANAVVDNAMEYLFSTSNYSEIVRVFIKSIVELFLVFIILYSAWLLSGNLTDKCFYKVLLFSTFAILTSVIRVLYILFSVLLLEKLNRA